MFPVYNPQTHPHQYYPGWSHGYPAPMEYHGCCNHAYHPPPPPYSHTSPYTPHGPYPFSAGSAYPFYHVPPHFFMEQPSPKYEYDMHCCGCPNHVCQPKQQNRGVRIEEHEPEAANKEPDALAPRKFQGEYPYPYVWFPPEHIKDKDRWRPISLKNDTYGRDEKLSQPSPKASNDQSNEDRKASPSTMFWFPGYNRLEESSNKDMKETTGENTSESAQKHVDMKANNQNNSSFPCPVFWFPGHDKLKESADKDVKASDSTAQVMEERQPKLKIIPVKSPGDSREKPVAMDEVTQVNEVQVQPKGETEILSSERPKKNHARQVKQDEEPHGKNIRSQSSSPRKASKLPPVCLRVDPFPRRKGGDNGCTSRSPSPPAVKSKVCQEENVPPTGTEVPRKCDHVPVENIDGSATTKEIPGPQVTIDLGSAFQGKEASGTVSSIPLEDKTKRKLSITEAAVVIQSSYRGFQVRKWQPLNKLKQIAKVQEQVNEIGARVQTLQSSSELRKDEKERILISEAIMSLLLQLDTIQGLHPTVRVIRKSVAKELTTMQEKLDSLFSLSAPEEHMPEPTNTQHAPFPLDVEDVAPESVERDPMEREHQLTVEEQRPILAEMNSAEQAAGVDPQFAESNQKLVDENQIFREPPQETISLNDSPSKPTSLSPTETESRYDSPLDSAEKAEESDLQLLATDEASSQVPRAFLADNQLSATSPTEDESRYDSPAESAHQPLQADDQVSCTTSSSSSEVQSDEGHLASPLNVEEIQVMGEAKEDDEVTGEPGCYHGVVELVEEPGVEVTKMVGDIGQSAGPAMVVMDQRASSGVQTPESEERNPCQNSSIADIASSELVAEPSAEELPQVLDEVPLHNVHNHQDVLKNDLEEPKENRSIADIVSSQLVVEPLAEELPQVLDEVPLHNVHNNLDVPQNSLEEEPTLVRDAENESESDDSVSKGDEESRGMASQNFQGALECLIMKEDNVDEQSPEINVDMAVDAGGASGESGEMGAAVVDKKLSKENESLRDVLGKLIEEGEKQMKVICDLNGRIKELERKLTKKNKVRITRRKTSAHLKQRV